jgi:hypothetical protein
MFLDLSDRFCKILEWLKNQQESCLYYETRKAGKIGGSSNQEDSKLNISVTI